MGDIDLFPDSAQYNSYTNNLNEIIKMKKKTFLYMPRLKT